MSFVKLKHEIDEEEEEEEEPGVELKVLSKDLAYPMLSWFIYPKKEKHFSYKPSTQEIYPYSKSFTDAVHFHIDYIIPRHSFGEAEVSEDDLQYYEAGEWKITPGSIHEKLARVIETFKNMGVPLTSEYLKEFEKGISKEIHLGGIPKCVAKNVVLDVTAEYGSAPPEYDSFRVPYFECSTYSMRNSKQAFAISAGYARKLNASEKFKDYLFFPYVHAYGNSRNASLFVLPKEAVKKAREFFNNIANKLISKGAELLTPEVKPGEEASEEEVAKAWGLKLD
jgi:hypothetical protein